MVGEGRKGTCAQLECFDVSDSAICAGGVTCSSVALRSLFSNIPVADMQLHQAVGDTQSCQVVQLVQAWLTALC